MPGYAQRSQDHSTMDMSICQHNDGVMTTDSSPYAAIVSTVALKRSILLASMICEMKIGLSLPIASSTFFFLNHTLGRFS